MVIVLFVFVAPAAIAARCRNDICESIAKEAFVLLVL
jgi:hypothetical protein